MSVSRGISAAVLGIVIGAVQFLLVRSARDAHHDPGISGFGKTLGEVLVVVVVTVVSVSVAFAVVRTRYWALFGVLVPAAQLFALWIVWPLSADAGWHGDSRLAVLGLVLAVIMGLVGAAVPPRSTSAADNL
jgi:hypothetical protein